MKTRCEYCGKFKFDMIILNEKYFCDNNCLYDYGKYKESLKRLKFITENDKMNLVENDYTDFRTQLAVDMQKVIMGNNDLLSELKKVYPETIFEFVAQISVKHADALIEELNKTK